MTYFITVKRIHMKIVARETAAGAGQVMALTERVNYPQRKPLQLRGFA
jgi:hypothetical protein